MECEVSSVGVECAVCTVEWRIWSLESGKENMECGVESVKCAWSGEWRV